MRINLKTGKTAIECEQLDIDGRSFLANCRSVTIGVKSREVTTVTLELVVDEIVVDHSGAVSELRFTCVDGKHYTAQVHDGSFEFSETQP